MKINRHVGAALLAFSALLAPAARAADGRITLNVPFSFVVAGRTLPAGSYTVETAGNLVYIRGTRQGVVIASLPSQHAPRTDEALVFHRSGSTTYLVQAEMQDDTRVVPGASK